MDPARIRAVVIVVAPGAGKSSVLIDTDDGRSAVDVAREIGEAPGRSGMLGGP
jgi:hypothetical protein